MNHAMLGYAAAAVTALAITLPAHAQPHQLGIGERRALQAAEEGPEALRQFIWRTRMIYGLCIYDFVTPE